MSKQLLILLVIVVALLGAAFWFYPFVPQPTEGKLDNFAKCVAAAGATMYGADWCPHCQNEKKVFGDSFKFVPYVECPLEPKRCLDAGIKGYPTWVFPDGKKLIGEQGLERLSEITGCPL